MTGPVRVTTDWSLCGLDTIIVENGLVRVVVVPELGGKVWQLTYVPTGKDLLWQHPRLRPRQVPFGSTYDDVFFGGWDELFPNDIPETVNGEAMPDHGEVWSLPWSYALEKVDPDQVTVHLWVETPISQCRLDKWLSVRSGEASVRLRHRIANQGADDLPYLWKPHIAVELADDSRIELGARRVLIDEWGAARGGANGVWYDWPFLTDATGTTHDMRRTLPADARICELQFGTDLERGWCAIVHPHEGIGLGVEFDPDVLTSCWTFATYGGWRSLRVVVLEPCSGYPLSVVDGVEQGTHQCLSAGTSFECETRALVLDQRT